MEYALDGLGRKVSRMVMLVMLMLMPTNAAADNAPATDQYVGLVGLVGPLGLLGPMGPAY